MVKHLSTPMSLRLTGLEPYCIFFFASVEEKGPTREKKRKIQIIKKKKKRLTGTFCERGSLTQVKSCHAANLASCLAGESQPDTLQTFDF